MTLSLHDHCYLVDRNKSAAGSNAVNLDRCKNWIILIGINLLYKRTSNLDHPAIRESTKNNCEANDSARNENK